MLYRQSLYALVLGSVGVMDLFCTVSVHAAPLANGSVLTINAGGPFYDADGALLNVASGSWFAMDTNGNGSISGWEKTAVGQGTTGLMIGVITTAGASHAGLPTASDSNAITAPWGFFGVTGADYVTVPVTAIGGDSANGLDFSGWTWTWGGTPAIPLGTGAWDAGFSNGIANFTWDGTDGGAYMLDYRATSPAGDQASFGWLQYALHLEGCVLETPESVCAPVPEASTYGMMLAGLGWLAGSPADAIGQAECPCTR